MVARTSNPSRARQEDNGMEARLGSYSSGMEASLGSHSSEMEVSLDSHSSEMEASLGYSLGILWTVVRILFISSK